MSGCSIVGHCLAWGACVRACACARACVCEVGNAKGQVGMCLAGGNAECVRACVYLCEVGCAKRQVGGWVCPQGTAATYREACVWLYVHAHRAALLSEGMVCAVAHVRGGGRFGPAWHAAGSGLLKHAGIEDLTACAETLVAQGITSAAQLCLAADSAGG